MENEALGLMNANAAAPSIADPGPTPHQHPRILYHRFMPQPPNPTRPVLGTARAAIEIAFIIFLFYANLLMGEFTRSAPHRTLSHALHDIVTPANFTIALISAFAGHIVFETMRRKL
jgi:hypothetical protein